MDSTVNAVCILYICIYILLLPVIVLCIVTDVRICFFYSWQWPKILKLLSLKDWKAFNPVKCHLSNLELIYLLYMVCILTISLCIDGNSLP
jgi:hypothetical protein